MSWSEPAYPLWFISTGARLTGYTVGILLQPFRNKNIKNKLFSEIVRRIFNYQDKSYGQIIDFRAHATGFQKFISCFLWFGFIVLLLTGFLLIFHDFIIFPEVGRARLEENY